MIDCEDPELSAEEVVARVVMADVMADEVVSLAILQKSRGDILGEDSPSPLLRRPCKDWVKYRDEV